MLAAIDEDWAFSDPCPNVLSSEKGAMAQAEAATAPDEASGMVLPLLHGGGWLI